MLQTQSVLAAENTAPAITIEKPDGWRQGETAVAITVDASHMPEGFSITKIEAKAGKDGSWQDVTGNGSISITGNQTVYDIQIYVHLYNTNTFPFLLQAFRSHYFSRFSVFCGSSAPGTIFRTYFMEFCFHSLF